MRLADVAQQCLVDRACQGELEVGVLAVFHVRETLVGECLEDGAGHFGQSGLGIVAVAYFTLGPADAETCADVVVGVAEQVGGQGS